MSCKQTRLSVFNFKILCVRMRHHTQCVSALLVKNVCYPPTYVERVSGDILYSFTALSILGTWLGGILQKNLLIQ